jgi:hypothetical protein
MRKGMMLGRGKGYKNVIGKDPMVHRQSAKGIKQPQPMRPTLYGWKDIAPFKRGGKAYFKSGKESKGTPKERIIRLHEEGYSAAAIALRTGMPIKYIESVTEKVVGGFGDNRPDRDFDISELKKGINIEMKDTEDPKVAKKIAKEHLTEDTEYYKKLAKMEGGDTKPISSPSDNSQSVNWDRINERASESQERRERVEQRREMRAEQGQHTNRTIGNAFFRGATHGRANNMKIVDTPTETLLVGYNWAVYGARNKATGRVTYYKGWRGYSSTTSKQLGQTGLMTNADDISDTARRLSDSI